MATADSDSSSDNTLTILGIATGVAVVPLMAMCYCFCCREGRLAEAGDADVHEIAADVPSYRSDTPPIYVQEEGTDPEAHDVVAAAQGVDATVNNNRQQPHVH